VRFCLRTCEYAPGFFAVAFCFRLGRWWLGRARFLRSIADGDTTKRFPPGERRAAHGIVRIALGNHDPPLTACWRQGETEFPRSVRYQTEFGNEAGAGARGWSHRAMRDRWSDWKQNSLPA